MRFSALVIVGLAGLAGWHLSVSPAATVTVNTGAVCRPGNDSTWVLPYVVSITEGDSVAWAINGGDADSLVLRPKRGQRWPFTGAEPGGRRARPARSGRSDTTGTFHYDIVLYCPAGESGLRAVVIDPDIIIGGR